MFGATFELATRIDYRYFWYTERCSFQINSLALNNCFSDRNVLQNGVIALSKMVFFFKPFFCQEAENFV